MWPARSSSAERGPTSTIVALGALLLAAVAAVTAAASPARGGTETLTRIHAAPGWGRPAVDEQTVYYLSKRHELFAVDRHTHEERWRRLLAGGTTLTAGTLTAGTRVALARDRVLVGDGDLFGVEASTGRLVWRRDEAAGLGVQSGRFVGTADPSTVWVGSGSGIVAAIDVRDGQVRWHRQLAGRGTTVFAPVVAGGLLVAAFSTFDQAPRGGGVTALDAAGGAPLWTTGFPRRSRLPASAGGTPLVVGDLVVCAASDGAVYAFNRWTGHIEWALPPVAADPDGAGDDGHEDFRALASVPPLLLVGSLSGVLIAYDLRDRRERWRFASPPDGSNGFALVVDGGLVVMPSGGGRLLEIDSATGRLVRGLGGPRQRFDWAPALADDVMYLAGEDGLYALPGRHFGV